MISEYPSKFYLRAGVSKRLSLHSFDRSLRLIYLCALDKSFRVSTIFSVLALSEIALF